MLYRDDIGVVYVGVYRFRDTTPRMENQMEKKRKGN